MFTYERYSMLVKKYGYGAQTHLNEKHILECFKSADTEETYETQRIARSIYIDSQADDSVKNGFKK